MCEVLSYSMCSYRELEKPRHLLTPLVCSLSLHNENYSSSSRLFLIITAHDLKVSVNQAKDDEGSEEAEMGSEFSVKHSMKASNTLEDWMGI